MRYIDQWLSGLGLDHIIPLLQEHGITTPNKLAQLSLREMYEVVGVNDAEDRKKLYFLIQRLQSILKKGPTQEEGGDGTETESSNQKDTHTDNRHPPEVVSRQNSVKVSPLRPRPMDQEPSYLPSKSNIRGNNNSSGNNNKNYTAQQENYLEENEGNDYYQAEEEEEEEESTDLRVLRKQHQTSSPQRNLQQQHQQPLLSISVPPSNSRQSQQPVQQQQSQQQQNQQQQPRRSARLSTPNISQTNSIRAPSPINVEEADEITQTSNYRSKQPITRNRQVSLPPNYQSQKYHQENLSDPAELVEDDYIDVQNNQQYNDNDNYNYDDDDDDEIVVPPQHQPLTRGKLIPTKSAPQLMIKKPIQLQTNPQLQSQPQPQSTSSRHSIATTHHHQQQYYQQQQQQQQQYSTRTRSHRGRSQSPPPSPPPTPPPEDIIDKRPRSNSTRQQHQQHHQQQQQQQQQHSHIDDHYYHSTDIQSDYTQYNPHLNPVTPTSPTPSVSSNDYQYYEESNPPRITLSINEGETIIELPGHSGEMLRKTSLSFPYDDSQSYSHKHGYHP